MDRRVTINLRSAMMARRQGLGANSLPVFELEISYTAGEWSSAAFLHALMSIVIDQSCLQPAGIGFLQDLWSVDDFADGVDDAKF